MTSKHVSRSGRPGASDARKAAQLCRQIREAIEFSLFSESDVSGLHGAWVAEVSEEAGTSAVRIHVVVEDANLVDSVREYLAASTARLRSEVAHTIHRKRTPHLKFSVWPPGASYSGDDSPDDWEGGAHE